MRVLIVSPLFPPEPVVSSQTSAQIAHSLIERGHDVTVITAFPSRPAGKLFPGYSRRLFQRTQESGFTLIRCFTFLSSKSSMVSRFLENISFGLTSGLSVLTAQKADVIYANTWPIFASGILSAVSRLRHIPMVINDFAIRSDFYFCSNWNPVSNFLFQISLHKHHRNFFSYDFFNFRL